MKTGERQDQAQPRPGLFQQVTFRSMDMCLDLRARVQAHAIERLAPGEADLVDNTIERQRVAWHRTRGPDQCHVLEPNREREAVVTGQTRDCSWFRAKRQR